MLERIESSLSYMRDAYTKGTGARDLLRTQKSDQEKALVDAAATIATWEQVQLLLTKTSEYAREQLKARIEETVTAALQAVFGDDLQFRVIIKEYRDQAAAEWQVVSKYGDVEVAANPQDARGGGIVDIVSLALRLAMLELARPKVMGPVVLDEPGKMVSKEYAGNMGYFLKQYAMKTGRQVILVSHNEELIAAADKTYRVTKNGLGESVVSEVG
jgi:DNA repair exonuclease SbcCD ATPase subunit